LGSFPNLAVLRARYPKLPQAHSCQLRLWRKGAYRGYACWGPIADSHWPGHIQGCSDFYKGAHLHYVHEGTNPTQPNSFQVNTIITQADYAASIQRDVTDANYSGLIVTLDIEQVWPYSTEKRLGIPQGAPGTTLASFYDDVFDPMFDETWRKFRENLLHLLMKKIEENEGLLRGFFLVEFKSSDSVHLNEYTCDTCGITRAEASNNCLPADLLTGTNCPVCNGIMNLTGNATYNDGIPLPAVGVAMGGTWLFTSGGADVWAHEIGHIRHLEHSPSYPDSGTQAPGGKVNQHDSEVNPDPALTAEPVNDKGWDRRCIMSYNQGEPLFFCGKCLMKNRGVSIESLPNPAGNIHD
jgi:hypothetical protein